MGILRTDRVSGLGGANAIKGSVKFTSGGALDIDLDGATIGTSNFTIEAWVFWFGNYFHQFTGSSSNNFNFYITSDDGDLKFWNGSSTYDFDASPVRPNEWTHVALVREGTSTSQTKVYVNGVNTNSITLPTSFSFDRLLSGINYLDGSTAYGNGYTSNLRVTLDAVYTSAFTPPSSELTVLDNTIVLCCQSPSNILQEATGKTIVPFKHGVNQGDAVASHFTPNSPVGFSTTTDVGTQFGSTFDGVTTFDSQAYFVPPGGNTRERNRGRGVIRGGMTPSSSQLTSIIQYLEMSSGGNTIDFGDGSVASYGGTGLASATRGVYSVGATANSSPYSLVNTLEFITIANTANAIDFGDLYFAIQNQAPMSNQTRGIFAAGLSPQQRVRMDFITIATTGNAQDFGDSIGASYGLNQGGQAGSTTRGLIAGGSSNSAPKEVEKIQFVTFASLGDAQDFGDLVDQNAYSIVGASSGTRALFAGGGNIGSPFVTVNTIQFVTIATTGNATDFGDLTASRYGGGGLSNSTRGCFAGGVTYPGATRNNIIDFVNIATTGNASDFGDVAVVTVNSVGTMSDSHGGL